MKFYITTPIYYANAKPHLGHAYATVIADIFARYRRAQGDNTFFLTGTADHGEKIVRAATAVGMGPQAFVNQNVEKFKELYKKIDISNDYFIRNSDKEHHWPGAQALWNKIEAAGDLYQGVYKGLYCVGCESFKTEKDLVDGKCPDHNTACEEIEEENYFFRLSKYADKIKNIIENNEIEIIPSSRKQELLNFINEGLQDISFSRPEGIIPWGIPVPGKQNQMMYVWCEELSNYISALGYGRDDDENFKTFWPADIHIVGKDILRFHAIVWPAMLLSAGLPLPKKILAHGMLISEGRKMSKTIGNVIDPTDLIAEYNSDTLRYYFAREISPFDDGDITVEKFKEAYNANLANGLGNLVSRTLKMSEQYFGGKVTGDSGSAPSIRTRTAVISALGELAGLNIPYLVINDILPRYHNHMAKYEVNKASDVVWELIGCLDQFVTDYEPFKLVKTDKDTAEKVLWSLLYGLHEISEMITPLMPATAEKIKILIGATEEGETLSFKSTVPTEPLFMRKS